MPRYFFHIRNNEEIVPDDEGANFDDYEAARGEAVASARDLAINAIRLGEHVSGWKIEIADEKGKVLDRISAREITD